MTLLQAIEEVAAGLSDKPTVHLADLDEANATIIDRITKSEFPVLLIIPTIITDEIQASGLLVSSTELSLYFFDKDYDQKTTDFKAKEMESKIIEPMRALSREFIHALQVHEIIHQNEKITDIRHQPVYSSMDANLFGVFTRANITFTEGITGCV